MLRKLVQFEAICLTVLWALPALAQNQPWSSPNGAVTSIVQSCASPIPYNRIAADDFQYTANTTINWIRWWGVVSNVEQLNRPYYIAIWNNSVQAGPCPAPCNPSAVLASWCLPASHRIAGTDCQNRTVYRFQMSLPAPGFTALANTKYWLQISEPDAESFLGGGAEDFHWSGYREPRLCPAQQSPPIDCDIVDDCPIPVPTDLSYVLGRTLLRGFVVVDPNTLLVKPWIFQAEIRLIGGDPAGPPMQVLCVEPDANGQYFLDHGLPDGQYKVTLIGMGTPRPTRAVTIQGGVGSCDFFDIFTGDLNNDGHADGQDIQPLVDGLMMGP